MGLILHLGVVDVAYSDASGGSGATTTGDVATILEQRYHIMSTFFALRRSSISGIFAESMAKSLQRLLKTGQRIDANAPSLTFGADQKIETEFRRFIFGGEMDTLHFALTGQERISAAAQAGVNHRKKRPYASSNKPRPSFVDTGLYVASFRAWTSTAPEAAALVEA
jgi:hypothetical protein